MTKRVLIAAITLCGCHPSNTTAPAPRAIVEAEPAPLPPDDPNDYLKGDLLQVPRHGASLWNGTPVDAETLKGYLKQVAQLSRDATGVVVEIEPGTGPDRAAQVRRQVIDSDLCRQHRCLEARWHEKRPVVY